MNSPENVPMVKIRDVTLRDGLQLTGGVLSVDSKVALFRKLLANGIDEIELGSMARPDLVPPLANSLEVVEQLSPEELEKAWIWVATPRHVSRAAAAGARNFQYCFSVSDSHNKANIGRSTEDSLDALPEAVKNCEEVDGKIQLCLATSFTCPFEGTISEDRVVEIVSDKRTKGTCDIVICDTIGQATPSQVSSLISRVRDVSAGRRIVYHGHDTWGLGVANALAAINAGATVVDGALGGLGGCPFAPGASGNTATEDLLYAFRTDTMSTESFGALVLAGEELITELGEENQSRSAKGAFASPESYKWAVDGNKS
ncbi:hydroxymethylglutaryl-CoA lyase [Corynebacterium ammoniagenes]|jgi:hydroxymethylglutaryl-CoA lyase|uniref:hydroxymethylglutaryl-CoA lyase n=1 Tax=Corynebacterium ammoniagenes TaxID=1697 RepID=UPI00145927FC|nr:hydroxymethylglutaryl-CoA lyase [Corynebacterium ammoniagenes]NMF31659.1 hydroxymethylglutaryl-CoA lyase [Corynebacterium ammoniagenes]